MQVHASAVGKALMPTRAAAASPPKEEKTDEPRSFGHYVPGYTGPDDGLSHPKFRLLCRSLNQVLISGCFRMEVEGRENIPKSGATLWAPAHPSMFDPPLVAALNPKQMRYLANIYVFDGFRGKMMTWGGAFPLNRENPDIKTMRHCMDTLKSGSDLCIFPEGGIADPQKDGHVGPLKKGAAYFAIRGGAENVLPIGIRYIQNDKPRTDETVVGALAATGVAAAGLAAGCLGGYPARVAVSALAGAVAGAYAAGKLTYDRTDNPEWFDPFPKYFATLNAGCMGAAGGAALFGITAALFGEAAPAIATTSGLVGGAATYGIVKGWRDRDIARVVVGKPIPVEEFRQMGLREGTRALTVELHRQLGAATSKLSGVPYDDTREKFRGKVEETLAQPPAAGNP